MVTQLTPLTDCPQHEHGDDAHAAGGDDRPDEDSQAERQAAVAVALQAHEAVADERAGETAQADRREGGASGGG